MNFSNFLNAVFKIRCKPAQLILVMKLTTIFLLASLCQVSASVYSQNITLKQKNVSMNVIFKSIEKQSEYVFLYDDLELSKAQKISVDISNAPIEQVLDLCLKNQPLSYKIFDKTVVLKKKDNDIIYKSVFFETISGKVTDESGQPIVGASILVKETKIGATTDSNGLFSLNASVGATLVVSFIGYTSKEVVIGESKNYAISLVPAISNLTDVVVTALGIKRSEKSLGYAVQKVDGNTLTSAKGVNVATSLTGKVAGLNIKNSTEFAANPTIELRGANALLVVDGVPYTSLSIDNISPDDILDISVLKGATASALYGSRGGNGAIMVTTKRGTKEGGLVVGFNSSNMFSSGFLAFPEVQSSYSSGSGGKYGVGDYVWGDKLDIGRTASQYNPSTYKFETMPLVSKGKDNLANFLQQGFILNNNINISQTGKNGGMRASFSHVYNQGQYPNTRLNKMIASISGDIKAGNFSLDGGFTFNKRYFPNNIGTGYGGGGYLYNLVVWSGSEYDVRDYKNYWVAGKENVLQNWMENTWYDNPYFIANEILRSDDYNLTNGYVNASYDIKPWLKAVLRSGMDTYSQTNKYRNAISAVGGWNKKGYYSITKTDAFNLNNDLMLTANGKVGDFRVDGLIGGSIYYREKNYLNVETQNGISVPGFYALAASVDPVKSTSYYGIIDRDSQIGKKQVNSLYGKASFSYKNIAFVDVTGRNDWSSTLSPQQRSFFYPSVSGSLIVSELIKFPKWVDMAKVRGSWTKTKFDLGIYDLNNSYNINTNVWNGLSTSSYPTSIRGADILPQTNKSYEYGAAFAFLKNKIHFDAAYFNTLYYNRTISSTVSSSSGFNSVLINTKEELKRKGVELSADGTIINTGNFSWNTGINWSTNRRYYAKLDPVYSSKQQWVTEGSRYDWVSGNEYDRAPDGQLILQNGYPTDSPRATVLGYSDPDWIWGFNNTFKYKNISFSFSFDGRVGGKAYNNMVGYMWSSGTHIDSDNSWRYDEVVNGKETFKLDGVKVVSGTTTRDTYGNILTDTRVFAPSTDVISYEDYSRNYRGVQDYFAQTFFKLRELSLTYNISTKFIKHIGMKNASIGFVGQNMLLWTKEWKFSDPDVGGDNLNSPSVRYMGFNVKANF
jgi:TonB-linked SusC/RagA family outer membrane protein